MHKSSLWPGSGYKSIGMCIRWHVVVVIQGDILRFSYAQIHRAEHLSASVSRSEWMQEGDVMELQTWLGNENTFYLHFVEKQQTIPDACQVQKHRCVFIWGNFRLWNGSKKKQADIDEMWRKIQVLCPSSLDVVHAPGFSSVRYHRKCILHDNIQKKLRVSFISSDLVVDVWSIFKTFL